MISQKRQSDKSNNDLFTDKSIKIYNPEKILDYINTNYTRVIWVTVAGKSNALSGVVAANTHFPVMACPPFENDIDMMVNIQSTLQMPSNVPVMTVLNICNLVKSCGRIFNLSL